MLTMRPFAIPLIRGLKEAGYGVYYLSNYSRKAYEECAESLAFMPYMDGGLVSFRAGKTKPSPDMYRLFLDTCGLKAGECLFVDDTKENVRAAEALGFTGLVFTSFDRLMDDLGRLGVLAGEGPEKALEMGGASFGNIHNTGNFRHHDCSCGMRSESAGVKW